MRKSNIPINQFDGRITNLENNYTIYEIFTYTATNQTGSISFPEHATIYDVFGDGIQDAIVVLADSNEKPIEEISRNSDGTVITVTSLNSSGNFSLSSTPSTNSCIVYYIRINDKYKTNVPLNSIISSRSYVEHNTIYVGVLDKTVPDFVNNLNGTITINSCTVGLRKDEFHQENIESYVIPSKTISLVDGTESYIEVNYNNGSPEYRVSLDSSTINGSNSTLVYVMWRQDTWVHSADQDSIGLGLPNKINDRILRTEPYKISRNGGMILSEQTSPNPRTIACSEAIVFKGVIPEIVHSFISSTDVFTKVIKNSAGIWTYISNTVYDNINRNPDGLGEVVLGNNKWGYRLFFRSIGDDKEIFYVLSKNEYNSIGDARIASELGRDIPSLLMGHAILVGRSLIQFNAVSGVTEPFIRNVGYYIPSLPNHNETLNKQGGTEEEYYHLTSRQYTEEIVNRQFGDVPNLNYTEFESDGTMVAKGLAVTYRDELPSYVLPVSGAAAPDSVAYTVGGVARQFYSFDGGNTQEILSGSFEIPHDYAYGLPIELHVHWRPSAAGVGVVKWFFDWEYSPPQGAPLAQTTLSITHSISNQQYYHLLTTFGDLPLLNMTLGGKIGFNLRRTPFDAGDTYGNDVIFEQIALHVPCDTLGSRQIYIK